MLFSHCLQQGGGQIKNYSPRTKITQPLEYAQLALDGEMWARIDEINILMFGDFTNKSLFKENDVVIAELDVIK